LVGELQEWRSNPEGERGRKIEAALVRYLARMSGRPTPFGLFAGVSVGAVGASTKLQLAGRERGRRSTRLDMDYLAQLVGALSAANLRGEGVTVAVNPSAYEVSGRLRYVCTRHEGRMRTYDLVAAELSPELAQVLRQAEGGATPS